MSQRNSHFHATNTHRLATIHGALVGRGSLDNALVVVSIVLILALLIMNGGAG